MNILNAASYLPFSKDRYFAAMILYVLEDSCSIQLCSEIKAIQQNTSGYF